MRTFKASLFASAIGTAASLLGVTHKIWPAHPQWALLLLTVAATAVLLYMEPEPAK
jgi:di/tricarboxylate transporter